MPKRDDDDEAFQEAMRGARPLPPGHGRVPAAAPPRERKPPVAKPPAAPFIVEQSGGTVAGRASDLAAKELRALRAGERDIDARIDLHGHDRASAVRELDRFVGEARTRGARVVLVIHGRGRGSDTGEPVLRPAVWDWLAGPGAERCGVMGFATAPPRHGGNGATIVMLRRDR